MKFINQKEINPFVSGYYIDSFDIVTKKADYDLLLRIIRSLYQSGDELFCICESSYIFNLHEIKILVANIQGEYFELPSLINEKKGRFFIKIKFEKHTSNFILKLWNKLDFLLFFKPATDLGWNTFISYEHNVYDLDREAIKMFSFNFTDYFCMRGAAGESLIVNYKNTYPLPDLSKMIKS